MRMLVYLVVGMKDLPAMDPTPLVCDAVFDSVYLPVGLLCPLCTLRSSRLMLLLLTGLEAAVSSIQACSDHLQIIVKIYEVFCSHCLLRWRCSKVACVISLILEKWNRYDANTYSAALQLALL